MLGDARGHPRDDPVCRVAVEAADGSTDPLPAGGSDRLGAATALAAGVDSLLHSPNPEAGGRSAQKRHFGVTLIVTRRTR